MDPDKPVRWRQLPLLGWAVWLYIALICIKPGALLLPDTWDKLPRRD